jgi:hypothetical protein
MASELKIAGVTVDPAAAGLCAYRLSAYDSRGRSSFEFARRVGALRGGVDPYLGATVELKIDDVLRFAGDLDDVSEPFDSRFGWVQLYRCTDLRTRADRVPPTDPTLRLDSIVFNLPGDDIDWRGSRAGKSLGYIIKYCIEAPDTAARLDALGIGDFSSFGWGAAATASLSGGGGLSIAVDDGGADYTAAPAVVLVGGDGTYTSATATVSAGEVTGISVSGASGWAEAPEVWVGTLPLATLKDLSLLKFISPGSVTVAGDYILGAIDGLLRNHEPNVVCRVQPDGTIRFFDLREFAGPRVVITGDGTGATARAITNSSGQVASVEVLTPGMDYTEAEAEVIGGGGSGAVLTVNLDDDVVDTIDVDTAGSGYRYARTLTLGTDPIEPFSLQRDARGCFTRVVVRGQPEAEMVELRLSTGDLEEDFAWGAFDNEEAKDEWSLKDFENAGRNEGDVTASTSLTVTVDPDDATLTWAANEWSQNNRKGVVFLRKSVVAGVESLANRRIVSNTALSAGGTSVLTLDRPLPSSSGWTTYTLSGLAGEATNVWRKYQVTNDEVARRMLQYSSYPLPIRNADGSSVRLTSTPVLIIQYSDSGTPPWLESPMPCTVDPDTGTVLADKPVVTLFGNRSNLLDGGIDTDGIPADVILYVPVNQGDLEAVYPENGTGDTLLHVGTAHTDYGLERTLITSIAAWRDPGQIENVREYAMALSGSVSDVPIEGFVTYLGLYTASLDFAFALNFAGDGYTTGWEDAALPVTNCELIWEESAAELYTTRLSISSRRVPYSAANFLQPEPTGEMIGAGLEGLNAGGLSAGGPVFVGQAPGSGFINPAQWGMAGPGARMVMGMSNALRSGAIGPLGAAVGMANAHVGGAMAASANLLGTASALGHGTFGIGGNGGGGPQTPRRPRGGMAGASWWSQAAGAMGDPNAQAMGQMLDLWNDDGGAMGAGG